MNIVALIVVFVAGFLIYVALKPSAFRIARSMSVTAQAGKIFPHINDLHKFDAWNPWARLDSNTKQSFTGPDAGVGACSAWQGNAKVGTGKMTIIKSEPSRLVRMSLD